MIIFQTLKTLPYMDRMEIVQKVLEQSKEFTQQMLKLRSQGENTSIPV